MFILMFMFIFIYIYTYLYIIDRKVILVSIERPESLNGALVGRSKRCNIMAVREHKAELGEKAVEAKVGGVQRDLG